MKYSKKEITASLSRSTKLTYGVLWNIIDLFDQPEGWWHWLLKYDIERVRPLVVEHAIQEVGLIQLLRTVADCYRYHIA